ncbi:hypothetical protein GMJLKIPL_6179 [Methylobacterium isbiliense]|uniref:Uncharacterized protein n=2 Tax=Methylobacterium isbiliense TaxID=315478 RepID=A0ABQ4SQX8_9HYPH|nr:hypothetical protein GMJLKIPL_6179 [Methylobacterium isbiliense]
MAWLGWVMTVLGGQAIAAGVLLGFGLLQGRREGFSRPALLLLALAGIASVLLMSIVNFAIHSDFRWLLIMPPIVWAISVVALAQDISAR